MRIQVVLSALAVTAFGLLTACGDGGSAVETRDRVAEPGPQALSTADVAEAGVSGVASGATPRPVMTANRRETTDAKVQRLFDRNGAAFGARTAEDYLARVQAFTSRPPAGTERVERANGDVLLYQASTNTFAVISSDGVPKTMFKPDEGAAYWAEQKAAAPTFGQRRSRRGDD